VNKQRVRVLSDGVAAARSGGRVQWHEVMCVLFFPVMSPQCVSGEFGR